MCNSWTTIQPPKQLLKCQVILSGIDSTHRDSQVTIKTSQHATSMPFAAPQRTIDALATPTLKTPKRHGLRCCALCNKRIYQRSDVWCTSTQRSGVWFARTPRFAISSIPLPAKTRERCTSGTCYKRPGVLQRGRLRHIGHHLCHRNAHPETAKTARTQMLCSVQ